MDRWSFELNYENNILFYDRALPGSTPGSHELGLGEVATMEAALVDGDDTLEDRQIVARQLEERVLQQNSNARALHRETKLSHGVEQEKLRDGPIGLRISNPLGSFAAELDRSIQSNIALGWACSGGPVKQEATTKNVEVFASTGRIGIG